VVKVWELIGGPPGGRGPSHGTTGKMVNAALWLMSGCFRAFCSAFSLDVWICVKSYMTAFCLFLYSHFQQKLCRVSRRMSMSMSM